MTPYLILDDEFVRAMTFAARRGVDVRIIMPGIPDKQYAFDIATTYFKVLLGGWRPYFSVIPQALSMQKFMFLMPNKLW